MRIYSLVRHLVHAQTRYRIHSPFVFALVQEALADDRSYYAFAEIEQQRRAFIADRRVIQRTDFGAGKDGRRESVSRIARVAACPAAQGRTLFRLLHFLGSPNVLELGTSLGLGTRYLAGAGVHQRLLTLEGDPAIAALAAEHLAAEPRVEQRIGPFRDTLPGALRDLGQLDFLYLDGDHTEAGTLAYVRACLPYAGPSSCFVLDDIHWSGGMERAWNQLIHLPDVRLSIDCYRYGLLFFRPEQRQKEHFLLYP
jgi:predicted O-methyltransferase YrrM